MMADWLVMLATLKSKTSGPERKYVMKDMSTAFDPTYLIDFYKCMCIHSSDDFSIFIFHINTVYTCYI